MVSKKRAAIMESLIKLLDKYPINKITVKDIVDDCGINRNTFYYHFDDISSLIEAIIIQEVDRIMERYKDISSMEECFEAAMRLFLDHRNVVYNIYNSSNRAFMERRLMEICKYIATQFVDQMSEGMCVQTDDRDIIIQAFKCEIFGYVIDWLNDGMRDDIEIRFLRLCELRKGTTYTMLERSTII